jgi:hypothetical protein
MKRRWLYGGIFGLAGLILLLPAQGINAQEKEGKMRAPKATLSRPGKADPASSPLPGAAARPAERHGQPGTPSITVRPGPKIDPGSGRSGAEPVGGPPMEGQQSAGGLVDQGSLRGRPGGRDRAPAPAAPSVLEEPTPEEEEPPPPEPDSSVSKSVGRFQRDSDSGKLNVGAGRRMLPGRRSGSGQPSGGVGLGSKVVPLPAGPGTVGPKPGEQAGPKDKPSGTGVFTPATSPRPPRPQEAEAEGTGGTAATPGVAAGEAPRAGRFTPSLKPPPRPEQ